MSGAVDVSDDAIRDHATSLLTRDVGVHDLALRFQESSASSAEVLVGGSAFYPRVLEDVAAARSSVHINQFGFRPGGIGDRFAEALIAKVEEGVSLRLLVDRNGSDPERASKEFYDRLITAGVRVHSTRATKVRVPAGALAEGGATTWNLDGLGHIDHRKVVLIDGRIAWLGGAGIEDHFEDGRFHDLFLRLEGPIAAQLQLVFVASLRWLGGTIPTDELDALFPALADGSIPCVTLHNAPGRFRPITDAIGELLDGARTTLDVVNPYVTDRRMIGKIERAARRGVDVRLFVPANANNWACAAAQRFHHGKLLAAGVRILEHPAMLHAKAFVRDREEVLAGTCNLEAWSLRRFFEIDVLVRSHDLAAQFDDRFSAPAEAVSTPGHAVTGARERLRATAFAALSPLL